MKSAKKFLAGLLLTTLVSTCFSREYFAYLGTYSGKGSAGIYLARYESDTGKFTPPQLAAEVSNPNFLAVTPNRKFLFAAADNLGAESKTNSGVVAYAINPTNGALTRLAAVNCGWRGVCHISTDATGRWLLAASYNSGAVAALPIAEDGHIETISAKAVHHGSGANTNRQASAHAHAVVTDPANRFVLVPDLGMDKVMSYHLDATLTPAEPPFTAVAPGSGPRHLEFHPNGKFAYVINELTSSVTTFAYDTAHGALKELQTVPALPAGFTNVSTAAEIIVHPSGKFLYASNRGHDSIAVFAVDEVTGKLTLLAHEPTRGKIPRFITLDPAGKFLFALNQDGGNLVTFEVDASSGKLKAVNEEIKLASPVCLKFVEKN